MEQPLGVSILPQAEDYIRELTSVERGAVAADMLTMQLRQPGAYTKQLRGPIRELIVGHHRITYFTIRHTLYFVRGFRKKTNKTPKTEIDYTEKIYKLTK